MKLKHLLELLSNLDPESDVLVTDANLYNFTIARVSGGVTDGEPWCMIDLDDEEEDEEDEEE